MVNVYHGGLSSFLAKHIKAPRRTARQIAEDIVKQLCDASCVDWLSNGEDAVHGRVIGLSVTGKGIRLSLDTQRHVTWKVSAAVVNHLGPMLVGRFGWDRVANGSLMIG